MLAARSLVAMGLIIAALSLPAEAQVRAAMKRIAGGNQPASGTVNLPYSFNDNTGNQWFFYQYGQFQQQGNMPVYSQGAMLQIRSEEHTSELQSPCNLVCRLLLEKKNKKRISTSSATRSDISDSA